VTDTERIDRQTLLKRAAGVAGAVYVVPVLTSAAGASTSACVAKKCVPGHPKKGDKKCAKKNGGNTNCKCGAGTRKCKEAGGGGSPCNNCDPNVCCNALMPCGACGNGGCFCDAANAGKCTCIDIRSGSCGSFAPCFNGTQCPAGQVCFTSCCSQPLCADPCAGASTGVASVRTGGAGMLFR
jgi:hypothetical protein